jgi:hypothetical protein
MKNASHFEKYSYICNVNLKIRIMKRRSIFAIAVVSLALLFSPTVFSQSDNTDQVTVQSDNSGPVGDGWLEGSKTGDVFGVWVPD